MSPPAAPSCRITSCCKITTAADLTVPCAATLPSCRQAGSIRASSRPARHPLSADHESCTSLGPNNNSQVSAPRRNKPPITRKVTVLLRSEVDWLLNKKTKQLLLEVAQGSIRQSEMFAGIGPSKRSCSQLIKSSCLGTMAAASQDPGALRKHAKYDTLMYCLSRVGAGAYRAQ